MTHTHTQTHTQHSQKTNSLSNSVLGLDYCVYHGHDHQMFLWPFVAVHWQKTFKIISLISGRLGPSLEHPYCSDVCIWRPYYRREGAGCMGWCILWDRQCHTRVVTGPLILPVENKNKGKVWLRRVLGPWVQLGCLPAEAGVPVYHLTRGAHSRQQRLVARTRNVSWVRANALWRQEYGSWQK